MFVCVEKNSFQVLFRRLATSECGITMKPGLGRLETRKEGTEQIRGRKKAPKNKTFRSTRGDPRVETAAAESGTCNQIFFQAFRDFIQIFFIVKDCWSSPPVSSRSLSTSNRFASTLVGTNNNFGFVWGKNFLR